jgi:DNA-binding MarR family transcriptional regulator
MRRKLSYMGVVTHGMRLLELPRSGEDTTLLLDEGREGSVALPQESLAALLGVRRPSLNKVLRDLERAGVVELSYRCVDILDPGALAPVAGRRGYRP